MVHHYEYSTINSHHKVLVNLQASNMDALKNQNYGLCWLIQDMPASELHSSPCLYRMPSIAKPDNQLVHSAGLSKPNANPNPDCNPTYQGWG